MQSERTEFQKWSGLDTVTNFDTGSTAVVGMTDDQLTLQDVNHFSPISLLIESLVEQLCKLLATNPKQQKKLYNVICRKLHQMNLIDQSYDVEEFEFMRTHYQRALFHLLTVAKSVSTISSGESALLTFPRYKLKTSDLLSSRYRTEFDEVEFIARGGFGRVYKARNKLDGMDYAVKKICLQYHNVAGFLHNLHEVKMLAKLNHPNIVSYKAAWLEPMNIVQPDEPATKKYRSSDEGSGSIVFERSSKDKQETCQEEEEPSSTVPSESASSIDESSMSAEKIVCRFQATRKRTVKFVESAMLYVQMQLCEQTLRQWLDERNARVPVAVDMKQSIAIFQQIVQGVCYIHSQHIVHHDIKPSNIFINSDLGQVQVGDFGLACCLQHSTDEVTLLSDHIKHKGEIGTRMYAAPEQMRGRCDSKSDLYSLGIVLLELLQPFRTDMERSKVITQLRTGNIPSELTVVAPKWAQLISRLVKTSPALRPSSEELQSVLVSLTKEMVENIDSKNETIQQLLEIISQRDREIEELRNRLQALETNKT